MKLVKLQNECLYCFWKQMCKLFAHHHQWTWHLLARHCIVRDRLNMITWTNHCDWGIKGNHTCFIGPFQEPYLWVQTLFNILYKAYKSSKLLFIYHTIYYRVVGGHVSNGLFVIHWQWEEKAQGCNNSKTFLC